MPLATFSILSTGLPGLDEPVACVDHMFHLEVDGCVHGGQDQTVVKVQIGCVHKVQQDGETLGVHFGIQADGTKVCVLRVNENRIKEATAREQERGECRVKYVHR